MSARSAAERSAYAELSEFNRTEFYHKMFDYSIEFKFNPHSSYYELSDEDKKNADWEDYEIMTQELFEARVAGWTREWVAGLEGTATLYDYLEHKSREYCETHDDVEIYEPEEDDDQSTDSEE